MGLIIPKSARDEKEGVLRQAQDKIFTGLGIIKY